MPAATVTTPRTDSAVPAPPSSEFQAALQRRVDGEVRFDLGSRATYSTDGSNYREIPLGVVAPRTVEAAAEALAVCREYDVPVLSRGGGTSLAGQTTNTAVVIDWTKYCNRLVSVDADARRCVIEPGIALDDLNRQLDRYGLMFGPRPSTHKSCTLGGMIGNNSCGSTAQAYGKTVDNVHRLEVLTYDGCRMWVGPTSDEEFAEVVEAGGRRADIYSGLRRLRDSHLAEIRQRFPDIPRRVSGYNLVALLPEHHFDLARALVGSEGTLITVLQAEIDLVEVPGFKAMAVLGYPDIATAADAVPAILPHKPWLLEGMDDILIDLEKQAQVANEAVKGLPKGAGWLFVQFAGDTKEEADAAAEGLIDALHHSEHAPQVHFSDDPRKEQELTEAREAGLGATAHPIAMHETWEGWEDSAVSPQDLGSYLREFRQLLDETGYSDNETALYGHFGQGCVHTRIPFELRTADGIATYRHFAEKAADLVVRFGGSLSGEHGDGQSRGELLPKMFGADIMTAFAEMKELFDPGNRMNPGKIVFPNPLDSHLRLGTQYAAMESTSFFSYPKDDGRFTQAALRCVGVGNCRSSSSDEQVMCPSYMVTREEEHSTRGRSRLLFEMVRGDVITDGWRSEEVHDALDLCFACKGCKSDCPVNVDMATYKAEFLAHHYAGRLRPAAHYSMGWLPVWAKLAAAAPGVVNAVMQAPGISALAKRAGGVDPNRQPPVFATERFTEWWLRRPATHSGERGPVLVWPDTFSNSFHPSVAQSAVTVLEAAGFEVRVPTEPVCCGLTWISTGQLDVAKFVLRRTVDLLRASIRAGVPVVGLEPSCTAVFRSDGPELLDGDDDMRRLSKQTFTLAELLEQRASDWAPPQLDVSAIMQTHCHQHAVLSRDADVNVLKRCGVDVNKLASGCCGLAGNFGFERGHYDVSMAAGERVLLPKVREADDATVVLADGFSCRTQIEQGETGRTAVHLSELLAGGINGSELGPYPESELAWRPSGPSLATKFATSAVAATAGLGLAASARRLVTRHPMKERR